MAVSSLDNEPYTGGSRLRQLGNDESEAASHRRRRVTESVGLIEACTRKDKVAKAWLLGGDLPKFDHVCQSARQRLWSLGIRKVCGRALSDVGLLLCDVR